MLILFVFASHEHELKRDGICKITPDVLCVKDVLMVIATAAKRINRTGNEIEEYILSKVQNVDSFKRYINFEMDLIHSNLPTSKYHSQFVHVNNINKTYLAHLLLEAHYAMSFYYNSIDDILSMNDVFGFTIDSWFKQIQFNLTKEIICQYRSVLHVYSLEWPSIDKIKQIEFSEKKYRNAPSLTHDVRSIIIARLLREWMKKLYSVINNLEMKFS